MALAEAVERPAAGYEDFERLAGPLLRGAWQLAVGIVHDPAEAEDIVQEASFKAWRGLGSLQDRRAFKPWFFSIVVNQCKSTVRRQRRAATVSRLLAALGREEDPTAAVDVDQGIRAALRRLPLRHREVIVLRYHLDHSVDQIADLLGVPAGTVMSRLHRALQALKTHIKEDAR